MDSAKLKYLVENIAQITQQITINLEEFKVDAVDFNVLASVWFKKFTDDNVAMVTGVKVALCVAILGTNTERWPEDFRSITQLKSVYKNLRLVPKNKNTALTFGRIVTMFVPAVLMIIEEQPDKVSSSILNEGHVGVPKWMRYPQSVGMQSEGIAGDIKLIHMIYSMVRAFKQAIATNAGTMNTKSQWNVLIQAQKNRLLYPEDVREHFSFTQTHKQSMIAEMKAFMKTNANAWLQIIEGLPESTVRGLFATVPDIEVMTIAMGGSSPV